MALFNFWLAKNPVAADKAPLCSAGYPAMTSDSNPVDNTSTKDSYMVPQSCTLVNLILQNSIQCLSIIPKK